MLAAEPTESKDSMIFEEEINETEINGAGTSSDTCHADIDSNSEDDFDLRRNYQTAVQCLIQCESIIGSLEGQLASKDERIETLEGRVKFTDERIAKLEEQLLPIATNCDRENLAMKDARIAALEEELLRAKVEIEQSKAFEEELVQAKLELASSKAFEDAHRSTQRRATVENYYAIDGMGREAGSSNCLASILAKVDRGISDGIISDGDEGTRRRERLKSSRSLGSIGSSLGPELDLKFEDDDKSGAKSTLTESTIASTRSGRPSGRGIQNEEGGDNHYPPTSPSVRKAIVECSRWSHHLGSIGSWGGKGLGLAGDNDKTNLDESTAHRLPNFFRTKKDGSSKRDGESATNGTNADDGLSKLRRCRPPVDQTTELPQQHSNVRSNSAQSSLHLHKLFDNFLVAEEECMKLTGDGLKKKELVNLIMDK